MPETPETLMCLVAKLDQLGAPADVAIDVRNASTSWAHDRQRIEKLERLAGFLRSVIQSGEWWTAACDAMYEAALAGKETPNG
jgi:hypothetical protein